MEQTFFGYVNNELTTRTFPDDDSFTSFCEVNGIDPETLVDISTAVMTSRRNDSGTDLYLAIGWTSMANILKAFTQMGIRWTDKEMLNRKLKNVIDRYFIKDRPYDIEADVVKGNNLKIVARPRREEHEDIEGNLRDFQQT